MTAGVVLIVQARTGSSRLPGKVLADIGGRAMLRLQLDRLAPLGAEHVVVATTDLERDDDVARLAEAAGVAVVRGSETDVLGRFGLVLDRYQPEAVVRLTGDCPLTDPAIVADCIDLHQRSGVDYTSNVHPRSFPQGLDVEVANARALRAALEESDDPYDREHVTPFLYRHADRFTTANLDSGRDLGDLRWTVDTAEDLVRVRWLASLVPDPESAPWTEILVAADAAAR
jgi:spore coat polysaccharide biosynthesis protein SpsF